jgi:hypothetical protein
MWFWCLATDAQNNSLNLKVSQLNDAILDRYARTLNDLLLHIPHGCVVFLPNYNLIMVFEKLLRALKPRKQWVFKNWHHLLVTFHFQDFCGKTRTRRWRFNSQVHPICPSIKRWSCFVGVGWRSSWRGYQFCRQSGSSCCHDWLAISECNGRGD